MTEREESAPPLEEFRESYKAGLEELLAYLTEEGVVDVLDVDPFSAGVGDRTLEELSEEKRQLVEEVIFEALGLAANDLEAAKVREYTSRATEAASVPGEIKVSVYKTNRDGLYLQGLVFQDGQRRWVVGPDENI